MLLCFEFAPARLRGPNSHSWGGGRSQNSRKLFRISKFPSPCRNSSKKRQFYHQELGNVEELGALSNQEYFITSKLRTPLARHSLVYKHKFKRSIIHISAPMRKKNSKIMLRMISEWILLIAMPVSSLCVFLFFFGIGGPYIRSYQIYESIISR